MARYRKGSRYYKYRNRANYTVQRRVLSLGGWTQNPADPQAWAASSTLVLNPTDGDNIVNGGGNKTVKHLEVQLLRRPQATIIQPNGDIRRTYPACVWLAVYQPEGYAPNLPFGRVAVTQTALYEPAQFVLGSGVIPYGGENVERVDADNYTNDDLRQVMDAGNATRIRIPLSKKLMPGDSIEFIVTTLDAAYGDATPTWSNCNLLVKYAVKYNCYVCS